jgi:hypothetical protein
MEAAAGGFGDIDGCSSNHQLQSIDSNSHVHPTTAFNNVEML